MARAPFTFAMGEIGGVELMVNRTGYTGEDGCELLCMAEDAGTLWDAVVARGAVPCGLGARDTLRLEVCYPLHGNDITQETDAISAGLGWVCALDKDFTGAEELRRIKEAGPGRKLVAFVMTDKAIPRHGMPIEGGGEVARVKHTVMNERIELRVLEGTLRLAHPVIAAFFESVLAIAPHARSPRS